MRSSLMGFWLLSFPDSAIVFVERSMCGGLSCRRCKSINRFSQFSDTVRSGDRSALGAKSGKSAAFLAVPKLQDAFERQYHCCSRTSLFHSYEATKSRDRGTLAKMASNRQGKMVSLRSFCAPGSMSLVNGTS